MLYSLENQSLHELATPEGELTDEELMVRIQNHDDSALALLYRRHIALLRSIIGRVVNNDHDVDDLLQEAFIQIWQRAGQYALEKGKAIGWIVTLVRRRAIDRLRKKLAYGRAEDRLRMEMENVTDNSHHYAAEEECAVHDMTEIFNQVLANLPQAQREVVQLAYYRGLSQREIAANTKTPLGTVKTRLELALRKIRSAVLAKGGAAEWAM